MRSRGLTLIEITVALAVLAVMASLAMPSFAGMAARTRLKAVVEALAGDVAEARFEAARRGQALQITAVAGADWCWVVATTPGCSCDTGQACALKTVRGRDHGGVAMLQGGHSELQAVGTAQTASLLFESTHGERLRVDISPLGRADICAPAGKLGGYADCPPP